MTVFCITFYFKGQDFLRACHDAGHRVVLLTHRKNEHKPWPHDVIDKIFYLESDTNTPQALEEMVRGFAWFLRENTVDFIVALDDFDVLKAATLREEFRIPGVGLTTSRYFRDKLAMRKQAAENGIPVPPFSDLFTNEAIERFASAIPAPWVLKPRSEASSMGIVKISSKEMLWERIYALGDRRHSFLVEQFIPGSVYHADSLINNGETIFCWASRYLNTPLEVAHGMGIFRSVTEDWFSPDFLEMSKLTADVSKAFGLKRGASHTEFIKSNADGKIYFLETSARVGGAHLSTLIEAASGINLWREWANIEWAFLEKTEYKLPEIKPSFAGILVALANSEQPDLSPFSAPEITQFLPEPNHIGFVLKSTDSKRILHLLDEYAHLVQNRYLIHMPMPDRPPH